MLCWFLCVCCTDGVLIPVGELHQQCTRTDLKRGRLSEVLAQVPSTGTERHYSWKCVVQPSQPHDMSAALTASWCAPSRWGWWCWLPQLPKTERWTKPVIVTWPVSSADVGVTCNKTSHFIPLSPRHSFSPIHSLRCLRWEKLDAYSPFYMVRLDCIALLCTYPLKFYSSVPSLSLSHSLSPLHSISLSSIPSLLHIRFLMLHSFYLHASYLNTFQLVGLDSPSHKISFSFFMFMFRDANP